MTNYNERLDEILDAFASGEVSPHWKDNRKTYTKPEAKQALTSLIKELVADEIERFAKKCLNHSERMYDCDGEFYQSVRCGQITYELAKYKERSKENEHSVGQ